MSSLTLLNLSKIESHKRTDFPLGEGSVAYLFYDRQVDSSTLVVFVHGFMGEATETWGEFPTQLLDRAEAKHSDLLFFGYNYSHRARYGAIRLYETLHKLLTNPLQIINPLLQPHSTRSESFKYSKLVIAAHSLGAIVSRLALLEACKNKQPWTEKASLILFAPAHTGSPVIPLGKDTASSWLPTKLFARAAEFGISTLLDLTPGSLTITRLEQQLGTMTANHPCLVAKEIVRGDLDRIVDPNDFIADPTPTVLERNHINICKPTPTYTAPVELVLRYL